ncbi:MAG TPA: SIMPL domain-containing protein, partial [Actinomycetota bacterium]|nr:SIMPL domain-containing protein [Actinomycetota bacterium]
ARRETRDARRETRDARRETRDARRETRRGYIASSRVEVSLPDTGLVGKLLAEAAARAEATVDGPRWEVAQDNPAQGEARRLAMVDARRRAEAYAQAAGLELGPIVEVAEVGAERSGGTMGMASHSVALAGGAAAEMPTHSHGLEIVAGVDVTYLLGSR